jgi:hypothetical protein
LLRRGLVQAASIEIKYFRMRRREWIAGLGGYSLVVLADQLPPSAGAGHVTADEIRKEFDRVAPPTAAMGRVAVEPHMRLVELDCDVLVAGGGLAGVCAAIAAARRGAKVVLVQDRSRLGGNSSSEVKMHVVGADCHTGRRGWRESGLMEELRLQDAVTNPQRCFEMWDLTLYDKVISEPNITLLLETTLYAAKMERGAIREVMARCDKSEHLYRVRARVFLDCTGDSRLGLEAGAQMREGREARAEFGESLAPEKADQETLGSSILFTSRLHHKPMPFMAPAWARKVTKEHLRFRRITTWEYGYWWIEWGGNLSTIRDNERIRFELLSIVMGVWDYIKNSGEHPSSDHWALDWIGMMPGKRGSRRMVGDHLVTEHDLLRGAFPDAIAIGGWPMDDHPPGGFDRPDLPPNHVLRSKQVFNLPFRALYSKNVPNLMMAGRNISATHAAFTSTRVMATCAVVGQAAGTAAAMCCERRVTPRQLGEKHIGELQQALLRDDQTIRDLTNQDPKDLARRAKASASGGDAARVIDGHIRDIPETREVHQWSEKLRPEGSWVELRWEKPQRISEVQITFDSGFQRQLTLSGSDSTSRTTIRAAQPETAKDYRVLYASGGEWKELARVAGNYQRLRRHRGSAETDAIRVLITATNGDEMARIFEIRCYA